MPKTRRKRRVIFMRATSKFANSDRQRSASISATTKPVSSSFPPFQQCSSDSACGTACQACTISPINATKCDTTETFTLLLTPITVGLSAATGYFFGRDKRKDQAARTSPESTIQPTGKARTCSAPHSKRSVIACRTLRSPLNRHRAQSILPP